MLEIRDIFCSHSPFIFIAGIQLFLNIKNHTMKKIACMLAALVLTLSIWAQDKTEKMEKKGDKAMDHKMKDCVMMEKGQMTVMKEGKVADMISDVTLSDGSVVSPNGKVTMKDGSAKMLKDGEGVYMDGTMTKMKMSKMKKDKM